MVCHKHQLLFLYFIVFSPYTTTNLALLLKKKRKKRANYSHSWGNIILNLVRQLILLKNMALLWAFIIDGYLRRHTL